MTSAKLRKAIRTYPERYLGCRAAGRHACKPVTVTTEAGYYRILEQCADCTTKRWRTITARGEIVLAETRYDWPDGYLLPEELTEGINTRPLFRLEWIRRLTAAKQPA